MQKIVKHFAMAVATLIGLGAAGTASANPTIIINDSNGGLVSYDTTTKVSTVLSTRPLATTIPSGARSSPPSPSRLRSCCTADGNGR